MMKRWKILCLDLKYKKNCPLFSELHKFSWNLPIKILAREGVHFSLWWGELLLVWNLYFRWTYPLCLGWFRFSEIDEVTTFCWWLPLRWLLRIQKAVVSLLQALGLNILANAPEFLTMLKIILVLVSQKERLGRQQYYKWQQFIQFWAVPSWTWESLSVAKEVNLLPVVPS